MEKACFDIITLITTPPKGCNESDPVKGPACLLDNSGFDFNNFEYINLSGYGGDTHVYVNSNQDIIDAFAVLDVPILINGCDLVIQDTHYTGSLNVEASINPCITLIDIENELIPCVAGSIDFSVFSRVNLSFFGGPSVVFVESEQDIIDALLPYIIGLTTSSTLVSVEINGCDICLINYTGTCENIDVSADPCISIIPDTDEQICVNGLINYDLLNVIDLTIYEGTLIQVNSDQDIINAFSSLGIEVTIENCLICLNGYIGDTPDVPGCTYKYVDLVHSDSYSLNCTSPGVPDMQHIDIIDMSPFGGSAEHPVGSAQDIVDSFVALGYTVEWDLSNCARLKTNNSTCEELPDLLIRKASTITSVDIDDTNCISPGSTYLVNAVAAASDQLIQNITIISVDNTAIASGGVGVMLSGGIQGALLSNGMSLVFSVPSDANGKYCFEVGMHNTDWGIFTNAGLLPPNYTYDTLEICFCVDNQIDPSDDVIQLDCGTTACIDITQNDTIPSGMGAVISIDGNATNPGDIITITTGLIATLQADGKTICLESVKFDGSGSIQVEVTNGVTNAMATLQYIVADVCNPCIGTNPELTFPMTSTVDPSAGTSIIGQLCWDDLFFNGSPVTNYLIEIIDSNGNPLILDSGAPLTIGDGSGAGAATFGPGTCVFVPADTYTFHIITSDQGDDLYCSGQTTVVDAIPCDGQSRDFYYSGTGGPSASLLFNIEVGPCSIIEVTNFNPRTVPDGYTVYDENGNAVFWTGQSAGLPHVSISPGSPDSPINPCGTPTVNNGNNATPNDVNDPVTFPGGAGQTSENITFIAPATTPVGAVWTFNTQGNPCTGTIWSFTYKCTRDPNCENNNNSCTPCIPITLQGDIDFATNDASFYFESPAGSIITVDGQTNGTNIFSFGGGNPSSTYNFVIEVTTSNGCMYRGVETIMSTGQYTDWDYTTEIKDINNPGANCNIQP